jgi:hypothetical protein
MMNLEHAMAPTEDDEVMELHNTIADLQQKNTALCAMLRDAIHLADLAIGLGASSGASEGDRRFAKARTRGGHFRGMSAKPPQA